MNFDVRSNLKTAVANATSLTAVDMRSTDYAERAIQEGKQPVSTAIFAIGDWKIIDRDFHSYGLNKVENEVDLILFFRDPSYFSEYVTDNILEIGLTLSNLGSENYQVINARVSEVEESVQLNENIWKRRFVFSFISIESRIFQAM